MRQRMRKEGEGDEYKLGKDMARKCEKKAGDERKAETLQK